MHLVQEDAAETLEAILENLHDCIAEGRRTDGTKPSEDHGGCQPPCVAHEAFGAIHYPDVSFTVCQASSSMSLQALMC